MRIAYSTPRRRHLADPQPRAPSDGEQLHFGRVCTADGQSCVRWDADGAKHARTDVRAAASKLKQRR